ncbi:ATP-binding protein [Bacillus cereus]|uniref:ATP-binding protein n=1 Tax=Bacillus cereus TaxID=1396 RepID=UPI0018CDC041|nr:AAA family ATPase [Bacillus cereus]MBG9716492.1 hypothetical protein [Bacillus cereus]
MSKYLISRVYLENFKSIDEAIVTFNGENLNVLDGPNGFGKTTIYDAIELVLTGGIKRISLNKIVTTTRGFNDHLLSKDQNKPTLVKVEFCSIDNPKEVIVLARRIVARELTVSNKRPNEFGYYKLYLLSSFEEEIPNEEKKAKKKEISSNQIDKLLGVQNIAERFSLYHYVQQEESTHLFKQNEKQRMDAISKLFNIKKEMDQKVFFEKIKNKFIGKRNAITRSISSEKGKYKEDRTVTDVGEALYFPLIVNDSVQELAWDREVVKPLDRGVKEKYLEELDSIIQLITYFSEFKQEQKNYEIDRIISNEEKLKAIMVYSNFKDDYLEMTKQYKNQVKLSNLLEQLTNKEVIEKEIDFDFLFNNLAIVFDKERLIEKIKFIKSIDKNANSLSKLVESMNKTREKLQRDFELYLKSHPEKKRECPMCGNPKDSLDVLTAEIAAKTLDFEEEFDSATKRVAEEVENLYEEYLQEIMNQIEEKIKESNKLDEDFLQQLDLYKEVVTNFDKAKEWFQQYGINIDTYINTEKKYVKDLDEKFEQLKKEIMDKKIAVSDFCKERMSTFRRLYKDIFQKNDHVIEGLTVEKIERKKRYLEYQYFLQSSQSFQKVQRLNNQLEKVNVIIESLVNIIKVYKEKINLYRGKMITDIEIPFYIYSGKIIQNHQRGIGVFIKEERDVNAENGEVQLKAISFVPSGNTDHDIVHSFSSGQLSSTVIAFTLALNKVYGNSGMLTLLIDDPVQTMDEMNLASFVELLRNDFSDRQIVLSTHEDKISLFMRYKFLKYDFSVGNINVKEQLYI